MTDLRHRVAQEIWNASYVYQELTLSTEPAQPELFLDAADAALADSLDAAWAEAEAALPEGWLLTLNRHKDGTALASTRSTAYRAGKGEIGVLQRLAVLQGPFGGSADASGPTPVVALHALVAKLREKSRSGLTTTATIPPT